VLSDRVDLFLLNQIQEAAARHLRKFISGMGYTIHFHELKSSFAGIRERIMREE